MTQLIDRFRRNVLARLAAKPLTQKELADRMGVTPPTVNEYLKWKKPGIDTIAKFAEALEVDPAQLLQEPAEVAEEKTPRKAKRQPAKV